MVAAIDISVTKAAHSKLKDLNLDNIPFGRYFTDHMLEADFEGGEWKNVEIKPFQPLLLSPSLAALHYGQAIFEGLKAFKSEDGSVGIFRPKDNLLRLNISAERMQMPALPEELFMDGLRQLVELDKNWIPSKPNHSLYIRPVMFSTDDFLGVRPSEQYKFLIILSPTGPYYAAPMRIYVEEHFVRAAEGGVGFAKAAGNYGSSMMAATEAKKKGYDQVLWTDATEHKYVQECGMMNVFFIVDNTAITPALSRGTILNGITRNSSITLLKEMGLTVEERELSIHEIVDFYKENRLKEVFGTGTAATISYIKELGYKDLLMSFDVDSWKISPMVKQNLTDIREGRRADKYGWMMNL